MKRRLVISSSIMAIALGAMVAQTVHAQLSSTAEPCQEAIAKNAAKFVGKKLKAIQKCNEKNMKSPGDCAPADLTATIAGLTTKLNDGLNKKCGPPFPPAGLSNTPPSGLGFPGKCSQGGPGNFTSTDLNNCIDTSHEDAVDSLIDIEWGTTTANANSDVQKCQKAIDKDGGKVTAAVLKAVQKCRNSINKGSITGILGSACATSDSKTMASITKAQSKATADISTKCQDSQIVQLDVCNPNATTAAAAAACVVSTHTLAADNSAVDASDLIDFEYAAPAICGDGTKNQLNEECDGSDDSACPTLCGDPSGSFACLCLNIPRERVIEHSAGADLDNGWDGSSHDSGTVEGGGYVVNLYDCNATDTCGDDTCTVGASCSGGAHDFCTTDAQCAFLAEGTCRTDRTDVGPHCNLNVQTSCLTNADCPGAGNFCVKTFHGPPLPLSAGGISVCVLNTFSENAVGTKNMGTGAAAVRIRQRSQTHLTAEVGASGPCPVCGGFCNGVTGVRHPCAVDADCADAPPTHTCNHSLVCNFGANADKACRADPPNGGGTALFGNPSIDCPPPATDNLTGIGLDILFNPATTQTVSSQPSVQCDNPAFSGKTCDGGTNNGATCTVNSQCPGGACTFQCYCPNGGAVHQRPNGCDAACVGGGNDTTSCDADSECPGGFCHQGDCRPDTGAPLILKPNEGACTATLEGHCSVSAFRTCNADADCQAPACTSCHPAETCNIQGKNCFVNSGTTAAGLIRTGISDPVNPVSASVFCIAQTNNGSVDATAGLPGPGALIQPESAADTGLTICP
ncbi:MAG TPA: hypothetical protein VGK30_03995 [Candidatus Binatia bacterium]|jgi:hypothetical protein